MKTRLRPSHPHGGRSLPSATVATVLVVLVAILAGGCVTVSDVELNGDVPAGPDHQITLTLTATAGAASPLRGVIAFRIPVAWQVKTVAFAGPALDGIATRSTVMEGVYATEWEAAPIGIGHNGPKVGYKWWAGYSAAKTWKAGDTSSVVITIDTRARGGTYYLDFVTGIAAEDDPDGNLSDKMYWQIGSEGMNPPGVLLDQQITLHCFTDVQPGDPFYAAIQGLGAMGLVSGYGPDGEGYYEFRPTHTVYRAQFAKFITGTLNAAGVSGFGVTEGMIPPVTFPDLGPDNPTSLYPHEYVWVAYLQNITKGYENGSFQPYIPISRAHVITMTTRGLGGLAANPLAAPPAEYVGLWGHDMLPEHAENARIAEYNGLLNGIPLAGGNAGMPRQEVAQIMWNTYDLLIP